MSRKRANEERNEAKVSRSVLESSGSRKGVADFNLYDYLQPPPHMWEGVRDKFNNLTIRIFEKSSHAPQFEEPELFDKELIEWLFNS
jgi:hypothetical protein